MAIYCIAKWVMGLEPALSTWVSWLAENSEKILPLMNQTCEWIISEIQLNLNPDYLKCTTKCDVRLIYIRFTVHDVLEIQRLVVTVPSPIHFLRKSCSIIMWRYMWKTALFTFVRHTSRYICFFFSPRLCCFVGNSSSFVVAPRQESDSLIVTLPLY